MCKKTCNVKKNISRGMTYDDMYTLLHLECHLISIPTLNLIGLFLTWEQRPRELDYRLRCEIEEMTLQMQQVAHTSTCTRLERRTRWRNPVEGLESQVSFRKRASTCRILLQKMTYKDKESYGPVTPCNIRRMS